MVELRNVINIYSELNPQIDIIILVAEEDIVRAYDLLKKSCNNWFDSDECEPIRDYLSDELNKAGIHHEVYYRAEPEEENGNG